MTPTSSASSEVRLSTAVRKPKALERGGRVAVFARASRGSEARAAAGVAELRRLGFAAEVPVAEQSEGYFAANAEARRAEFSRLLDDSSVDGLRGLRGGYGANYLLDARLVSAVGQSKAVIGFSDLTSLQIFLWQQCRWVTFYGPMVAAGFDAGAGAPGGDDEESLPAAISKADVGWEISLRGQGLAGGQTQGRPLGRPRPPSAQPPGPPSHLSP